MTLSMSWPCHLADDPASSSSAEGWPAPGCEQSQHSPQPCPRLSLLPAVPGDCELDWQVVFEQSPSRPLPPHY